MDFLSFMEETWKKQYALHPFIIENVELRLIENGCQKYRDIVHLIGVFMLIGNEYF